MSRSRRSLKDRSDLPRYKFDAAKALRLPFGVRPAGCRDHRLENLVALCPSGQGLQGNNDVVVGMQVQCFCNQDSISQVYDNFDQSTAVSDKIFHSPRKFIKGQFQ